MNILFLLACSNASKDSIAHNKKNSGEVIKAEKYSEKNKESYEENSIVRTVNGRRIFEFPMEPKIVSSFGSLKNSKGVSMFKTKKNWRFPKEITLPPGNYFVKLNCGVDGGNMYGHRSLTIQVEPEKDYTLFCLGGKGKTYFGIDTFLNFYSFFAETKDVDKLKQEMQNKIDDSSHLDFPVKQGNTRVVFFNDTVTVLDDPTFGTLTVSLDKNNNQDFQRGQYFHLEIANGEHLLELSHKDLFNFHDAYGLTLDGGILYIKVFNSSLSTKYEILKKKPADFDQRFKPLSLD